MSSHDLPPPAQLLNLIIGKSITQTIVSAVELGLIDAIADATRSADDVASATGVTRDGAYRVLRALSVIGILVELENRTFSLTPMGQLLRSDVEGSLAGMARLMGASFHTELWFELSNCLKTGEHAVKKRHGWDDPFHYFHSRPDALAVFHDAMSSHSTMVANAIVGGYDFAGFERIADVGGGHGALLHAVLKANPSAKGLLFDLPDVVVGAKSVLADVADRCEIVGGNFFEGVPGGCDAYLFKSIIHDWSDANCVKILKPVAEAMAPTGRVLLIEHIVPPAGVPSFSKLLDLEMLVVSAGGRERTEDEFREVLASAGLRLARVVPLSAPVSVIEAVRA
jgi:hypothetical protein